MSVRLLLDIAPNTDQKPPFLGVSQQVMDYTSLVMTTVTHVQSIDMKPKGHLVITETIFGGNLSLSQRSGPLYHSKDPHFTPSWGTS